MTETVLTPEAKRVIGSSKEEHDAKPYSKKQPDVIIIRVLRATASKRISIIPLSGETARKNQSPAGDLFITKETGLSTKSDADSKCTYELASFFGIK